MKPWDDARTERKMRRLSAERTLKMFFEMSKAGRRMLYDSVRNENPGLETGHLKEKVKMIERKMAGQ